MLRHRPGMPLDRKSMERNSLDPLFCADQELSVSLKPSPERRVRGVVWTYAPSVFLTLVACLLPVPLAGAQSDNHPLPTPSLFIEVQLDAPLKLSHLVPGNALQGMVTDDVYSGCRLLFPAGSRVHLTLGNLERRGREHNDHWPWEIQFLAPRHEYYPSFQSASISLLDGTGIPRRVPAEALISTATDASTAGSARLVGAAFSALYLITRHGRDVILPKYTKLDITFNQPLPLSLSERRNAANSTGASDRIT
jgi:hypothetical protein